LKKAVIIFGSPRKDGNTRILVEECLKGLADSGIESITLNYGIRKPSCRNPFPPIYFG
jgi:multimeric flavodoxin WrbA